MNFKKNKLLIYTLFAFILTTILVIPTYNVKAYKPISSTEVQQILSTSSSTALIIDVRTPEEFSNGHIPKAINIPLQVLKDSILSKNLDKHTKIILYCSTGVRSKKAGEILDSIGFHNIYQLGGINKWPYPLKK